MRRLPRPNDPAFIGAPIPHRCRGEGDRPSMITMAYFHSWTLRNEEADAYVSYAGSIRPHNTSWEETIAWLDCNVMSRDFARYVADFHSVFRVWPRDDVEDVRSDEEVEDEEIILQPTELATNKKHSRRALADAKLKLQQR